ncbi:MAG TPA: hypothetical protein VFH48_06430 [Chloroflexota bacterium]|nr:hypothetical protein [Chloroflexota bacterium]
MERGLLGGLGIVVALFGALFFVYFITELSSGGDGKTQPGVDAGLIVFFGGLMAAGAYLAWRMLRPQPASSGAARPGADQAGAARRPGGQRGAGQPGSPPPPATEAERERRVLRLAEQEHGRVTVPEVAARCNMTFEESKAELDRLVLHDVAEIQVTASGVLVYVFRGFLSDKDKAGATDF